MTGKPDGFQRPPRTAAPPPSQIGWASVSNRTTRIWESDRQAELDVGQNALDHPGAKVGCCRFNWGPVGQQQMGRIQPLPGLVRIAERLLRQRGDSGEPLGALTGGRR